MSAGIEIFLGVVVEGEMLLQGRGGAAAWLMLMGDMEHRGVVDVGVVVLSGEVVLLQEEVVGRRVQGERGRAQREKGGAV